MSSALNRTTKQYIKNGNTPDYPETEWIINPDMSSVDGQAAKYWLINGDVVSLMSPSEMASVDAALDLIEKDNIAEVLDSAAYEKAFAETVLDELNSHADKHNEILSAISRATSLVSLQLNIAAIADYPPRTLAQLKNSLRSKL